VLQLDFVYEMAGVAAGSLVIWNMASNPEAQLGSDRITVLVMSAVAATRLVTRVARSFWQHGPRGIQGEEFPPDRWELVLSGVVYLQSIISYRTTVPTIFDKGLLWENREISLKYRISALGNHFGHN